ncbi:uncharacterized protein LOC107416729 isoform X2 [Ziziphus jujuba]|nr:uncharacterized protein LOC107416729 isoform X2 [Ziziphus jujuba]
MSMLGASTVAKSPLLTPVVESRRQHKLAGSDIGSVHLQFRTFDKRMANLGPVGLGAQFPIIERRKSIIHSVRRQSNSIICAAALSATCSASQTQTVTRQAPTITHMPAKEKSPQLDDGGTGFPPRDDGDGGGGGGGGGGNWSGGFFFFGFLLFLGFLKDKESEGPYRDDRRR